MVLTSDLYSESYLENAPSVFFKWRNESGWPVEYVSNNVTRLLGYSRTDFLTHAIRYDQLIHPDDLKRVTDEVHEACHGSEIEFVHHPYRILKKNRDLLWVEDTTRLERDTHGAVIEFHGYISNITSLIEMQEALLKRELEFRTLVENLPDNIIRYDRSCRAIYVSPTMTRVFVKNAAQLRGKTPTEAGSVNDIQDKEYQDKLEHVILSGETEEMEFEISLRSGGDVQFHHIRFVPERHLNGEICGALAIGSDITERKHAERTLANSEMKFRTLYNSTSDAVMLLDEQGYFECNPATLKIFGYTTQDEICAKHPSELSPPRQPCGTDSRILADQHIAVAVKNGRHHFEWTHRRADDGKDFPTEVLLNTMELNGKTVLQATVRDITARKLAEEALKKANHQLSILSITDGLTGIANRRHFDETLAREYARHSRSQASLSLILLDIDHFKAFNDCYGHIKGDDCLRLIARVIADHANRAADLAARYGGEEFACILPETELAHAVDIAEKIRTGIQALTIPHKGSDVADSVTASLGVISVRYDVNRSMEDVLVQVDKLLYRAKSSGRNQVAFDAIEDRRLTTLGTTHGHLVQLTWEDSFCCGNRLIDSQHQALFLIANTLLDAVLERYPQEQIATIVTDLLTDVTQHFYDEEHILETIGFPGLKNHAEIHAKLLRKGVELAQNFTNGTLDVSDLFKFLVYDMVKQHMLGADREYGEFIRTPPID